MTKILTDIASKNFWQFFFVKIELLLICRYYINILLSNWLVFFPEWWYTCQMYSQQEVQIARQLFQYQRQDQVHLCLSYWNAHNFLLRRQSWKIRNTNIQRVRINLLLSMHVVAEWPNRLYFDKHPKTSHPFCSAKTLHL